MRGLEEFDWTTLKRCGKHGLDWWYNPAQVRVKTFRSEGIPLPPKHSIHPDRKTWALGGVTTTTGDTP